MKVSEKFNVSFNKEENAFFSTLKMKVDDYFKSGEVKSTGNYKIYLKAIFFMISVVVIYTLLVFVSMPIWLSLLLCAALGLNLAAIGFNIMHDAAHGSFSSNQGVNNFVSHVLNVIGGNVFLWKVKHNVMHHTYTNIDELDDDIDLEPWMRVHSNQDLHWYHRFQYIYWVFLYGITYLLWIFVADFIKYFSGKVAGTAFRKMDVREHIIFWASKLAYIGIFIVIPMIKIGVVATIIGYFLMAYICGFAIAVVFQMAHLTEYTDLPQLSDKTVNSGKIEQQWAIHQVLTTADFATHNKLVVFLTGGLNFQVEHHLFPRISHVHYPNLSKIVKDTCNQFNIPYKEFPSFFSALKSHVRYLKQMGVA